MRAQGKGQGEQGAAGDHKGLVKIPRIFLALPNPASLAPTDDHGSCERVERLL